VLYVLTSSNEDTAKVSDIALNFSALRSFGFFTDADTIRNNTVLQIDVLSQKGFTSGNSCDLPMTFIESCGIAIYASGRYNAPGLGASITFPYINGIRIPDAVAIVKTVCTAVNPLYTSGRM
jgi:hypothetical protein